MFIDINEEKKHDYNLAVNHPLQSYEWGEFRKKTGVKVIRRGLLKSGKITNAFTLTLHKVPKTKFNIGYLPKGEKPTEEILEELNKIGLDNNCIFIQLEPNIKSSQNKIVSKKYDIRKAAHPLFTKFTFILDISRSEEELLSNMHHKTRYNIRLAAKKGVRVFEDNSEKFYKEYFKLMEETTERQKFYAHTPSYHKTLWEMLPKNEDKNSLSYHLLNAVYKPENGKEKVLTSWVLFTFHDYLYYPYGASSREFREVMANNLVAWEAIKIGKKMGLKYFDMWGALGEKPNTKDPWYGFHKFKQGYGAQHVEFVGSYDLVIKPAIYELYKVVDKLRWIVLKIKR